jgi:hypothetical protein
MPDSFIDSSVLIGLHFRHAGERAACDACLPSAGGRVSSRYVVFEIARGFLRSLINLHNASLEFVRFSELHQAAYSGARGFRRYEMHTWLGAMTDFMAALELETGSFAESQKLELLRARLRVTIQRGWRKLLRSYSFINDVECRQDLPEPTLNADGMLTHALPVLDCGKPHACGILSYIDTNRQLVQSLADHLEGLPEKDKGTDTDKKHLDGLRHLLESPVGEAFKGKKCHRCGDALICLEAPQNHVIATKNETDFRPIASHLGKALVISKTATATTAKSSLPGT